MKRTSIYLTEQQTERLEQQARHTGLKTAEIIRRAIDEYLNRLTVDDAADRAERGRKEGQG